MTRKIFLSLTAVVLVVALLCGTALAVGGEQEESELKAGAGAGAIVFDEEMFSTNTEGFSGEVADNPYARVLLLEDGEMAAIVSLELVSTSETVRTMIRDYIVEKTGMPEENIWIHTTHAITTPHAVSGALEQYYTDGVMNAIYEAVDEAVDSFQPAVMGIGTGTCSVNVNRNIEINGEWYIGWDDDDSNNLLSNETMTVIRFDDLNGDPIGMYISYGIKPTAIDNSGQDENIRQISPDVPGKACALLEEEYGCPVMFCMPAAGDQIPAQETNIYQLNEQTGAVESTWLSIEDGLEIVERLGAEMEEAAVSIIDDIVCDIADAPISVASVSYEYDTTGNGPGGGGGASNDSTAVIPVSAITVGDQLAFVGFQPELDAATELELWEESPYEHTLLVSFLNGDSKYMPHSESYDLGLVESQKTNYAQGCAEEFVSVAAELLETMQNTE